MRLITGLVVEFFRIEFELVLEAIFCDLDGTLVDTRRANFLAYGAALEAFGKTFTLNQFQDSWGKDSRDFLPLYFPDLNPDLVTEVRHEKALRYLEFLRETTLNKGLLDLLRLAKASKTTTVLVTTAKRVSLLPLLEFHGIQDIFDFIVSGEDVSKGKPSPEPYLMALNLAGCKSEHAVTFEDSHDGVLSAQRAGIKCVQVLFGESEL